jgi:hypothetical protein
LLHVGGKAFFENWIEHWARDGMLANSQVGI